MSDVSVETKRGILLDGISLWERTRYARIIDHKVAKAIEAGPDDLKRVEKEISKCEIALDTLKKELATLEPASE